MNGPQRSFEPQCPLFAAVFGAVYVLVGLAGFVVTGLSDFAATSSDKLILFGLNPLHNRPPPQAVALSLSWLRSVRKPRRWPNSIACAPSTAPYSPV